MKFVSISLLAVSIQSAAYGSTKLALYGKCTKSEECGSGLQCDSFRKECKRSISQACTWNKECADELQCLSKKCSAALTPDRNFGIRHLDESCDWKAKNDESKNCEKGVICDVKRGNVCKKIWGQSCEANKNQCHTGLNCLNGRCSKKSAGEKCSANTECEIGLVCKDTGSGKRCEKDGY